MKRALLVILVLAACRASKPAATPTPGMSYEAYMMQAAELERQATHEDQSAEVARQQGAQYQCETHPESEQTTSGTERMQGTRICDDVSAADRRRHEARAKELREAADHQRGLARSLLDADRAACDGIAFDRLRDPPLRRLAARAQVANVDGGTRITLSGDDLDVDGLRRELGCHYARAALGGFDAAYMPSEPSTVAGSHFRVEKSGAAVTVTVLADDADAIDLVRRRADALVGR
ncbi:MAG TPA: hypothetical protein VM261_12290 [Kofleriaceae bacterium]|nr:hypothetical protein [Kofleriaceae bacterium]